MLVIYEIYWGVNFFRFLIKGVKQERKFNDQQSDGYGYIDDNIQIL